MKYGHITRPEASENKIRFTNDFELCYLRHQYFRRAQYNPTVCEMYPYLQIVERFASSNYFTYEHLFRSVGFLKEDIVSVGKIQIVSFIGLYALERSEEKKKLFAEAFEYREFRAPTKEDFLNKNKANFTIFLKQRMKDLVRVCNQKVRNIKGQPSEDYLAYRGKNKPPKYLQQLIKEHDALGFKKLNFAIFKSIRKNANVNSDATVFCHYGTWYVAIPLEQKPLSFDDIVGSGADPSDNYHNMQPDEVFKEKQFSQFEKIFNSNTPESKIEVIKQFIAKNEKKGQYKKEISTARKMLKDLGA